ncbi:hypothetical protein [Amycolatopsis panacis]|uniref:Uncharacterized protein n=1 Tax=Amycolatopsis panacis TaxID=2340917 RepID=A0A419I6A5_9PSEU|nr:hypothetical protein [Amycolatopsis panacis]RJQ86829.1 hypothetical protein D5S19_10915 [Amycolatopsis panacis]
MGKNGYAALEALGLISGGLAGQAIVRSFFDSDTEPLWGAMSWVPGGRTWELIVLGFFGVVGLVIAGIGIMGQKKVKAG